MFLFEIHQMITIATLVIGHDYRKGLVECLSSKREYAAKHGYKYVEGGEEFWDRSRPIPWSKVGFMLQLLNRLKDGDLVWLSDADVLITNMDLRLEEHILPHIPEEKDMLMCIDACGHLNSGNLFMRNSAWLRNYWSRVGEQTDLTYHIWWENAAMIKLLELNADDLNRVEIVSDHTRMNSYYGGALFAMTVVGITCFFMDRMGVAPLHSAWHVLSGVAPAMTLYYVVVNGTVTNVRECEFVV
jgi:hypothetical protein